MSVLESLPWWPAPARWLPGGHLQTIWPAVASRAWRGDRPRFRRERWLTPDGDFVDADWLITSGDTSATRSTATTPASVPAPVLVLFHGLEGSSGSPYALAFAQAARDLGWGLVVPHFRGCSGELNLAPRAYHSGDHAEIGWMLAQAQASAQARGQGPTQIKNQAMAPSLDAVPMFAAGVSLGGNALLRWAQEAGEEAGRTVRAVSAICSPVDLLASGHALGRPGVNRQVYTRMFLRSMKPKALRKLAQHPGLFDRARLLAARDLYEFDNVFTAPLHGFQNTDDYWRRASSKPHLTAIRVPALVINPLDDPFVPAHSLPRAGEVGDQVTLWQPPHGGHVGFASGAWPGQVMGMPQAVTHWMAHCL